MKEVIERWADRHLAVPRWIVSTLYFLFVALGTAATVIGIPTIDLTTPNGYAAFWGIVVVVTAIVAGLASLRERFEVVERYAAIPLSAFLVTYTAGAWALILTDVGQLFQRGAGAIVLTIMSFIPVVRCIYMLTRIGRAPRLRRRRERPVRVNGIVLLLLLLTAATPVPTQTSPTGIDLSWLPNALIGLAAVAGVVIGIRNSRRDRTSRQVDMQPPDWPSVYKRLDSQDTAIRALGQILADTLDQWPANAPFPQYDASLVNALGDLDNTLVPSKLRKLLKTRKTPRTA